MKTKNSSPVILCGTDFTAGARHASRVAAAFAQRLQGSLVLAHAVPKAGPDATSILEENGSGNRKSLMKEAAHLRNSNLVVQEVLPVGRPDEALVRLAQQQDARLLVLAAPATPRAEHWLRASVTERSTQSATMPALVVRDAEILEAWLRGEKPLKVFVAFNFTATAETALRWVRDLEVMGPCEIVIAYVDWPPEHHARLGTSGPLPLTGNLPEIQAALERDLQQRAADILGHTRFRARVEASWGRADAALARMAHEEQSGLLIVGSHQYRGFERLWHASASRGLLHHAEMNLAVVPLATAGTQGLGSIPSVRRVLVATDFSENANVAIPHACSLLPPGGTLQLIHVVSPHVVALGQYAEGLMSADELARHEKHLGLLHAELTALLPPEAGGRGLRCIVQIVEHDEPGKGICETAERFGADVICIATVGQSGLARVLLGSVVQQVMTHTRRPLLVIRPPAE